MVNSIESSPKMTGRRLFRIVGPVLHAMAAIMHCLPRRLAENTWWMVAWLPGKVGIGLRYVWAKRLCHQCGDNVLINQGVVVRNWEHLSIGSNVTIHQYCYVDALGGIEINSNVSVAHGTSILSFDHSWDDRATPIKYNPIKVAPVKIGPDVWIGCGVRVLSGSTIGERTIVAAGAVVPKGTIEQGVYGGVPAKLIGAI
jgi:acetyltransferase-like isoleucine patch superfamily enzyme